MKTQFLSIAAAAIALTMSAQATMIVAGATGVAPDVFTNFGAAGTLTVLATTNGTLTAPTFTANYADAVYKDTANVFCSGCLDFAYEVQDTGAGTFAGSTGILEHITASFFTGFLTDVGYSQGALAPVLIAGQTPATGVAPNTIDRSIAGPGAVVTWDYTSDLLGPGAHTALLIIETNATAFNPGLVAAIDGSSANGNAFEPTTPSGVPEPGTMFLLGAGLLGLGTFTSKRRSA